MFEYPGVESCKKEEVEKNETVWYVGVVDNKSLKRGFTCEIDGLAPFNFELTVNKPRYGYLFTPFERHSRKKIWTGLWLNRDIIGLRLKTLSSTENPLLSVDVFSNDSFSNREEREFIKNLKKHLQLDVDISDFYKLAESYPVLRRAKSDLYGMRDTHFPNLLNAAIVAITLQMTTWERSLQMMDLLYNEYGERLSFDGARIIITPDPTRILRTSEEELRQRCGLGYRARFIRSVAKASVSNFHTLEDLEMMNPGQAKKELMKIRGIGEYSADIITPHPSFPVDSWSMKIFCTLFGLKAQGKLDETIPMIKHFAQKEFGRWQGYVYAYILHDLENIRRAFNIGLDSH